MASDIRLLLREVDLIAEAQSHPLRNEGCTLGLALANLYVYNNIMSREATRSRTRRRFCYRVAFPAAVTHLTLGSDAYVSCDGRLGAQVDGLLDADVSQGVFSKDRTGVKVGGHEAAEAGQSLTMGERTISDCFLNGNGISSIYELLR